ncbi:hypothetical protein CPPEL_00030 [Corynebacterium pseudopelargi]|uniref:Uncharacterized protein n=2 Tax=Corynebacteriaceae TaxID=1653 RepID=A0A3G6IVQ5_9CORY|nr:hypothetical protein CPPEL_00030 [Corynebacterium pseudopelargi]
MFPSIAFVLLNNMLCSEYFMQAPHPHPYCEAGVKADNICDCCDYGEAGECSLWRKNDNASRGLRTQTKAASPFSTKNHYACAMSDFTDLLNKREAVAEDLARFINEAVARQSGITGVALKGAVAAAKKAKPGIVEKGAHALLPELVDALDPHWLQYKANLGESFGQYLSQNQREVCNSLLEVADRNAKNIDVPGLDKAYKSLRGKAEKILGPELQGLGDLLESHVEEQ